MPAPGTHVLTVSAVPRITALLVVFVITSCFESCDAAGQQHLGASPLPPRSAPRRSPKRLREQCAQPLALRGRLVRAGLSVHRVASQLAPACDSMAWQHASRRRPPVGNCRCVAVPSGQRRCTTCTASELQLSVARMSPYQPCTAPLFIVRMQTKHRQHRHTHRHRKLSAPAAAAACSGAPAPWGPAKPLLAA